MLNGDEASPSNGLVLFLSFSEHAHVKDGHVCDKNQYLFQEMLPLIVSYYCTVTNSCESKSDIYSLLIRNYLFR